MFRCRHSLRDSGRVARRRLAGTAAIAAAVAVAGPTRGGAQVIESEEHRFRIDTVVSGLERPWGMTFLPGGDLLLTERAGRVRLVRGGVLQAEPVAGGPAVHTGGQAGLLDIALHPDFAENSLVYMTYSKAGAAGATTALARARFDGTRLNDLQDVFVADAWGSRGAHFGSRIVFDSAGMLYISVGERGEKTPAQELGNHKGTILRLHDDGRVPQDNPFVGREGARPEIFSYGHRNPQGMALHPSTGAVWANEHGARGGDEINIVRAGRNYGWPAITHGVDYSGARISPDTALAGMEQPLLHWTPSIAPSGMAFYTGTHFPRWQGNVFNGALAGEQLRRVVFDGDRPTHQESLLDGTEIRAVKVGPDGNLYLLTWGPTAALLRLAPAEQ